MPVAPQDRPLQAVRDETIDRLIVNYGHGKLSLEAFERRLDQALDAKTHDALLALTADLELGVDAAYSRRKSEQPDLEAPRVEPGLATAEPQWFINVFGGTHRRGRWTVPREIKMLNIFGGADLDFSTATFSAPVTHITLFCLFGGANFYVNESVNAVSNVHCLFGGIDNRAPAASPSSPTVVLDGIVIFGGASLRVRKSLRDRWVEFAEQFKSAFGEMHHRY